MVQFYETYVDTQIVSAVRTQLQSTDNQNKILQTLSKTATFLKLPEPHSESNLQKGLLKQMKNFILELGRDFIFIRAAAKQKIDKTIGFLRDKFTIYKNWGHLTKGNTKSVKA